MNYLAGLVVAGVVAAGVLVAAVFPFTSQSEEVIYTNSYVRTEKGFPFASHESHEDSGGIAFTVPDKPEDEFRILAVLGNGVLYSVIPLLVLVPLTRKFQSSKG